MTQLRTDQNRLLERLRNRRIDRRAPIEIAAVTPGTRVALSPAQARIWFFTRQYPDSAEYNVFETLTFDRAPEQSRLRAAVGALMRRHDALRLTVLEVDGCAMQQDSGIVEPPVEWHDLRWLPPDVAARRAEELGNEVARRPLRTDRPPLFRVVASALPGGRISVALVLHHLIIDYWSTQQLLDELGRLLSGRPLDPPAQVRFLDYVSWQHGTLDESRQRRELDYWTAKLGGALPVLALPKDRARPAVPTRIGHTVQLRVPPALVTELRLLAGQEGTTLFVVLLAAYKAFLSRLTGQTDLAVGAPLAGRDHPVSEKIIGCFVKPVALRTDVAGQLSFRELVRRVHATVVEAQDHQVVPYERIVAELGIPRDSAIHPIFQTFFALLSAGGLRVEGAEVGQVILDSDSAKWDLTVCLTESGDDVAGFVEYASDLFEKRTVDRFVQMYLTLLAAAVSAADTAVPRLPLLPAAERRRILTDLNPYQRPSHRYRTLAEPFEEQVWRTPDAVALVGEEGTLSYAELNARANRLAHYLRAQGARPGTFVGVCAERSFALIVALYAISKSGAAYVPLDPELPDGRLAFMTQDTNPVLVLTDDAARPRIADGPWQVISVAQDAPRWAAAPGTDPSIEGSNNHLAHLLYTSGSTGRPKAVAYPVSGALADIFWLQRSYPFGPGDANVLKTSYGFDVSIWEIFWPLYFGARLVVCRPGGHRDPYHLIELIEQHDVTTIFLIPTMMQVFLEHAPAGSCPSLRWVFCGGEPVTPRVRDGFHARFDAHLINCYGPTEAGCVTDMILPREPGVPIVPLGRPAANFRLYVLDGELQPVPVGVPGEALIGGEVGLAQGYHNRPSLTAERFLPDPFGPPGGRLYRTGDLCRYRDDGVLEHLGRIGRQVKIRGMRIELAEIEAVLCEHPSVQDCVVLAPDQLDQQIAAFVVPREGAHVSVPSLLRHAERLLPAYMVPVTITEVTVIPSNINGKTDQQALLRGLEPARTGTARELVAPEGELETRLAEIFRKVLGVDQLSVTDGFFELGGHSLLIFKLLAACAQELHLRPTVSDVFAAQTVRELASRMSSSLGEQENNLVRLAPNDGKPIIVCVHAASGSVLPFLALAQRLATEFEVYGMQAPDDPDSRVAGSIEHLAAHYVAAVDSVRGFRPLVLVGWSMGGCIALEMAREWQRHAVDVAATIMLDTWTPPPVVAIASDAAIVRRAILELDVLGMEGFASDELAEAPEQIERLNAVLDRNVHAFLDYTPGYYDGHVDLLRATETVPATVVRFPSGYLSGDRRWGATARSVGCHDTPGNHFTLLAEENADQLAELIGELVAGHLLFEEI